MPDTLSILQNIANAGKALPLRTSRLISINARPHTPASPQVTPLSLPIPPPIYPQLVATGISSDVAQKLSDRYIESAREYSNVINSVYTKKIPSALGGQHSESRLRQVQRALQQRYQKQLQDWLEFMLSHPSGKKASSENRSQFNQNSVPMLEKYFQQNAYPSAADRVALAKRSSMTPRQIEVWFQNHRNRARKEGKALRRMIPGTHPTSQNDCLKCDQTNVSSTSTTSIPLISTNIPVYVFPAPYLPGQGASTEYESPVFDVLEWPRTPATRPVPKSSISVDDLAQLFASKLVLRSSDTRKRSFTDLNPGQSYYNTTYVVPSPAPHPSLVRRPSNPEELNCSQTNTLRRRIAPLPRRHGRQVSPPALQRSVLTLPPHSPLQASLNHESHPPAGINLNEIIAIYKQFFVPSTPHLRALNRSPNPVYMNQGINAIRLIEAPS
uniref:HD2 protein n=1 Tax=Volvariella volvacea TaxID=36659 RepID=A0A1B2U712_9AGAR|nr:HD2 protein [Volvariella volvacea]